MSSFSPSGSLTLSNRMLRNKATVLRLKREATELSDLRDLLTSLRPAIQEHQPQWRSTDPDTALGLCGPSTTTVSTIPDALESIAYSTTTMDIAEMLAVPSRLDGDVVPQGPATHLAMALPSS